MPTTLSKSAFALEKLLLCEGYKANFINRNSDIDARRPLTRELQKLLPTVAEQEQELLHYTGMSVAYNTKRRVPFYAAYNIDGNLKSNKTTRPKFRADPRIGEELQLGYPFYDLRKKPAPTEFEIGHMASNNEMGRGKDGQLKAWQTFHFTNSVPQAEKLNTGIWSGLESYIIDEAATIPTNKKICVFTGPILKTRDPKYLDDESFRIPLCFFKVIVFPTRKGLFSTAFIMSHAAKMFHDKMIASRVEALTKNGLFDDFNFKEVFQVNLSLLEEESGLRFNWPGVKRLQVPKQANLIQKIKKIKDAKDAKDAIKAGGLSESLAKRIPEEQHAQAKKAIRKGVYPEALLSKAPLTAKEIKTKNFKLNIILP